MTGLKHATVFKKKLRHWCLPINFAKFLRTLFTEHFQVQVPASWTLTLFSAKYVVQIIPIEADYENICSMTV